MKFRLLLLLALTLALPLAAQEKPRKRIGYPPEMEGARVETYKEVDGTKLNVWIFDPPGKATAGVKLPAIVFFFGGGWSAGSPEQFQRQCRYFSSRGLVAIAADYRVSSRNQVKAAACVADAKSCLRWVRREAGRLGIDPQKIVAAGGSAGGHLAAAVATLPGLDDPQDDQSVSAVPNALILFNPALVLAPFGDFTLKGFEARTSADRFGCDPKEISPVHHVKAGLPPTAIFHGKADTTVPHASAELFTTEMIKAGNRCDLHGYEGQPHGFFNVVKYDETVATAENFLVSLGYIIPLAR